MKKKFTTTDIPENVTEVINNANYFDLSSNKNENKDVEEKNRLVDLKNFLNNDRKVWEKNVINMSKKINNLDKLNETYIEIHSQRQILLEYKFRLYEKLANMRNKMSKKRKLMFEKSKTDYDHTLKNGGDKTIFINAGVSDLQEQIDLFSNHIDYLDETLKNIESITWAIKSIIEYEKIKSV